MTNSSYAPRFPRGHTPLGLDGRNGAGCAVQCESGRAYICSLIEPNLAEPPCDETLYTLSRDTAGLI